MISQEFRFAIRGLLRTPGFAVIAVLTVGLAIGANAAIYSLVQSVLLDPLPFPASERLVRIRHPVPGVGVESEWGVSEAGYFYFADRARSLEAVGAYGQGEVNLGVDGEATRVRVTAATSSLLDLLGARPVVGRLFTPQEDTPGAALVALLGHGLWVTRFGADPSVVGRSIRIDGLPYDVVGVLPPGFDVPDGEADLWIPLRLNPANEPINDHSLAAIGLRADGFSVSAVESELRGLVGEFTEVFPGAYSRRFMESSGFTVRVADLRDDVVGDIRPTLWILLAAVGLVLAIACANVLNLFLVRVVARTRELAVRSALGARRGNLALFFFSESYAVALLAGATGLVLGAATIRALVALAPESIPRLGSVHVGLEAVVFTLLLTLVVGAVLGAIPLLRFAGAPPSRELVGSRSHTAGRRHRALQGGLVVAQMALALLLLTSAGLLIRSFRQLRSVDPGFDPSNLITFDVALPYATYGTPEAAATFHERLLAELRSLPGVVRAAGTTHLPLAGGPLCVATFTEAGAGQPGGNQAAPCLAVHKVSADYFTTMGIPIVAGRGIDATDEQTRRGAAVVSRSLAERLWPGRDPIGQRIRPHAWGEPWHTVVGVAEDVRYSGLDQPPTEIGYYQLHRIADEWWMPANSFTLVIRTRADNALSLADPIRRAVTALDPNVAVANLRTMTRIVAESTARTSFAMMLLGCAAAIALVLGTVGLYGVISYVVSQRSREVGVRMALGAQLRQVALLVIRRSLALALAGIALGVLAALAATRVLESLLFETEPTDPLTIAGVSVLLLAVALLASWIPARRAARVQPMDVLRVE